MFSASAGPVMDKLYYDLKDNYSIETTKLSKYIKDKQYMNTPIMELYDQPNDRIKYISSVNLPEDIFKGFLKSEK